MFKSKIILFLIFICFGYSKSDSNFAYVQCVDDSKIKQACAVLSFDKNGNPVYQFIKKHKCKKNKKCLDLNGVTEYCANDGKYYPSFRTCQEAVEPKKEGEKCNYGEECKSQICESNKCVVHKGGEDCKNNYSCPKGSYYCNSTGKCSEFIKNSSDCDNFDICEPGYFCNYNNNDKNGKCAEIGSVEANKTAQIPELCATGLAQNISNETNFGNDTTPVCFNVTTETNCTNGYCDEINITSDSTELPLLAQKCDQYESNSICSFTKSRSDLFLKYKKLYQDLDKSKILEDENFRLTFENMFHYNNDEVKVAYYKYKNYGVLMASDIISSEGKTNTNKQCEYNVLFYGNNGGYIMISFLFFTLLFLLFG